MVSTSFSRRARTLVLVAGLGSCAEGHGVDQQDAAPPIDGAVADASGCAACAPCVGTPWGTVPHGFSATAYERSVAIEGTTCESTLETRTCVDGALSGSYTHVSCTNYVCEWNGGRVPHAVVAFEAPTFPAVFHECGLDGTWSASMSGGNPAAFGMPCEWSARWFEPSTCGAYDGATHRCQDGAWVEDASCPTLSVAAFRGARP